MRWYLSVVPQSGSAETLPERIVLVKKGEAPVATLAIATTEGYGTIYTESSYVMPQGVVGYAVTQADTDRRELSLTEAYVGGETVPAHTALLVKGEKRNYLLFAPRPNRPKVSPLLKAICCLAQPLRRRPQHPTESQPTRIASTNFTMPTPTTPARSVWASTGELQKVPPSAVRPTKPNLALTSEMAHETSVASCFPGDRLPASTPP